MNGKIGISVCALACSMSMLANNAQLWTKEDIIYVVAPKTALGLSQENRIGVTEWDDGRKHLDEIHIAPSIDYLVLNWLSIGANYRHVLIRNGSDARYTNDRRPGIDIAFKKSIYGISLLNRSRFICRIPEGENSYFRYRNLSKVSYSLGDFSPFASYEWYFDEGSHQRPYRKNDRFSQQWLSFGIDYKVCKNLKATLYYMLTENKNRIEHNWYPGHVLGIGIAMSF